MRILLLRSYTNMKTQNVGSVNTQMSLNLDHFAYLIRESINCTMELVSAPQLRWELF